jgi:hypothetical protein
VVGPRAPPGLRPSRLIRPTATRAIAVARRASLAAQERLGEATLDPSAPLTSAVRLTLHPVSDPLPAENACLDPVHYDGPRTIDGRATVPSFLALNDARWASQEDGMVIYLASADVVTYEESLAYAPDVPLMSRLDVTVRRSP